MSTQKIIACLISQKNIKAKNYTITPVYEEYLYGSTILSGYYVSGYDENTHKTFSAYICVENETVYELNWN